MVKPSSYFITILISSRIENFLTFPHITAWFIINLSSFVRITMAYILIMSNVDESSLNLNDMCLISKRTRLSNQTYEKSIK